jgi:UDP-N-acetylmuramate dehydrogenase
LRSSDELVHPREHVPLSALSTLGVGGPARWFVTAASIEAVAAAHRFTVERGVPLFVLGGGSNIVIADEGIAGCVVHVGLRGVRRSTDGEDVLVTAGAGEPWDEVVDAVVRRGLAGVECLSGIPGSVGGTPIQNVGAYGQEVADTIERLTVYDRTTATTVQLGAPACEFAYRTSRFKARDAGRFVVCDVTFRVRPGAPTVAYPDVVEQLPRERLTAPSVADVRAAVLAIRRRKGMVIDAADADTRSVGSFFMNPVVTAADRERIAGTAGEAVPGFALPDGRVKVPAAWLIERAGFRKGDADGPVGVSTKHPLALVNRGGATARDVLRFAGRIKRTVVDRFGVWLRPEPVFVGFGTDPGLSFLQKAAD